MYLPRLRDMRNDAGMVQKEIAVLLGTSQTIYSRYERGARDIPLDFLIKLARFYNTSTDYLLGLTNDRRAIEDIIADHAKK